VEADEEILRLVIHGVLHLLGHDHPEGDARYDSEMFRLQEAVLAWLIDAEAAGAHPSVR
jgi:probable rRNA maturation factor